MWEAVIIPDNQQKSRKFRAELNVNANQDGKGMEISDNKDQQNCRQSSGKAMGGVQCNG